MKVLTTILAITLHVCLHAQTTLLSEDFEQGVPSTWTVEDGGDLGAAWDTSSDFYNDGGNTAPINGTYFAQVWAEPHYNKLVDETLTSPEFDASGFNNLELTFDHVFYTSFGANTNKGEVQVFDGNTWVTVKTYTTNTGFWNTPDQPAIDITQYANATMKIRFRYYCDNQQTWGWGVDKIRVTGDGTSSVSAINKQRLTVYPNPASDKVYIDNSNNFIEEGTIITIRDITGKTALTATYTGAYIDVSTLNKGMYYISINSRQTHYHNTIILY